MKTKYLKIEKNEHKLLQLNLSSGDGEDYQGCTLNLSCFGLYATLKLPAIIKPRATKVNTDWDDETIARLGRDYYYHYDRKDYGISLYDGHLSFKYGVQTNSSNETKQKGFFLTWTQHTFISRTIFNVDGSLYAHFPAVKRRFLDGHWDNEYNATQNVKKEHYLFMDYDLEEIIASCFIEERVWHKGTSWCSWLKYFNKPMVRKDLEIEFSSEVGSRKGSWKGGTLGTSIVMLPDELAFDAFLRYCYEHNLRFVDIVDAPPEKPKADLTPKNAASSVNLI